MAFLRRVRRGHQAGARVVVATAREQLWHSKVFLGLRCDLAGRESRHLAGQVSMRPESASSSDAFLSELPLVRDRDVIEVLLRIESCEVGVETLYVHRDDANQPAYAQWLITPATQDSLHAHAPGRYDRLGADEGLLEGAYTFVGFRGRRLMAEGMSQLLDVAHETGLRTVYTYVGADNVPSLRGCARVGFTPDHVRISTRRVGRRRSLRLPLDPQAIAAWHDAVGA